MAAPKSKLPVKSGMSTLATARFGPGMLLQHDDLEQLNKYTQDLSRLLFRSLFGCGVVCGLTVDAKDDCHKLVMTVKDGVALACSGDPIHVPKPERITIDTECDPDFPSTLWIALCATRKCCSPRPSMCSPDDEEPSAVCTREYYAYEIRVLAEAPECACICNVACSDLKDPNDCQCVNPKIGCYQKHYAGECGCECGECDGDCDCHCVVLARLDNNGDADDPEWVVTHGVRRFVRPILMEDPQVRKECEERNNPQILALQLADAVPGPEGTRSGIAKKKASKIAESGAASGKN